MVSLVHLENYLRENRLYEEKSSKLCNIEDVLKSNDLEAIRLLIRFKVIDALQIIKHCNLKTFIWFYSNGIKFNSYECITEILNKNDLSYSNILKGYQVFEKDIYRDYCIKNNLTEFNLMFIYEKNKNFRRTWKYYTQFREEMDSVIRDYIVGIPSRLHYIVIFVYHDHLFSTQFPKDEYDAMKKEYLHAYLYFIPEIIDYSREFVDEFRMYASFRSNNIIHRVLGDIQNIIIATNIMIVDHCVKYNYYNNPIELVELYYGFIHILGMEGLAIKVNTVLINDEIYLNYPCVYVDNNKADIFSIILEDLFGYSIEILSERRKTSNNLPAELRKIRHDRNLHINMHIEILKLKFIDIYNNLNVYSEQ